jgi:hypothetical protein
VGKNEQKFFIQESHIRISSECFNKAFSSDSQEITDYTVHLPEVNPTAFELYVKWLYSRRFYIIAGNDVVHPDDKSEASVDAEWTKWGDCYKLGFFLLDHDFKGIAKQNAPPEFLTDLLARIGVQMRRDQTAIEDVDQFLEDLFEYDDPCKFHEHSRHKILCHKEKRNFAYE